jgi:hypothetical protein
MTDQKERREDYKDDGILPRIEDKVDLLLKLVTGNGDPSKGLIVRFDRVEQKMKWIWCAIGMAGIGIVKAIYEFIKGGG